MVMEYKKLVSRNQYFISKKLQLKIKKSRLLFVGCGLGTQIALLAARMGFVNFILVDGDNVEINNLNRQAFRYEHIGRNKAEALTQMIKDINPKARISYYPFFLRDKKIAKKLIDKSDFVINMADPDKIMYFINNYAPKKGKPVLFPLNIIWGGFALIFTKDSAALENIIGKKMIKGNEFYLKLLQNTFSTFPKNLQKFYKKMGPKILKQTFAPQLGAAAFLTSSIIVSGIICLLAKKNIKKAPHPIFLDLWEEI